MDASPWQVLVVEDEYDSVQMISKILEFSGAKVIVANNGVQCLEMLEGFEPDIVIMDLAMPEMDGWQTLVEIRSNMNTAHIPVVAVTAYYSDDVEEEAYAAGFDAYFPKPLDPKSFVEEISGLVK